MSAYLSHPPLFTSQVVQSDFSRCASPLISFLHYSETCEVNSHCLIDVPTCNCCATVPTSHSCLLYWLISLSTQSTNWLQLWACDFRLQKQRAAAVVLNYLQVAHWSRHQSLCRTFYFLLLHEIHLVSQDVKFGSQIAMRYCLLATLPHAVTS